MYLQMDGVDDRVTLPSMTFTEIVMDFRVNSKASFERYWSLPLGAEFFQVASGAVNDQWSTGVSSLYLNGAAQTNLTPIMATGTRGIARSVLSAVKTNTIYIFSNNTGNIAHGDLWDIKIYNGATLQAHYDMSTGTVQDQSGNGRHATLIGGTWINDGPVGVDVSYSYATKQAVYSDRVTAAATKLAITADRTVPAATRQLVYSERSYAAAIEQRVYADRLYPYATLQVIADGGVSISYGFATKQAYTALRSYPFATLQTFYEQAGNTVISVVELSGILDLEVELKGYLEMTIELRGEL